MFNPEGSCRLVMKDFQGIITMVLVKRNDERLIRALQNTVTSPPPKPER